MKKIVIAGASLNSGNRGINALTRGTILAALDHYKDIKIVILSYCIKSPIKNYIDYNNIKLEIDEIPISVSFKRQIAAIIYSIIFGKLKNKELLKKIIKNYEYIDEADMILDITDGDSFSDIYGFERFLSQSWIKVVSILNKKKIYLMPQTIGPFKSKVVKMIAKYIIKNVNYNFARDRMSLNLLKNYCKVNEYKIRYIPDMAFYMVKDNSININKELSLDPNQIKIGINISALLYNGGYNLDNMFSLKVNYRELINKVIQYFLKDESIEVILIPHVIEREYWIEDDLRICKELYTKYRNESFLNIHVVEKGYNELELKSIISGCDFFVGSRMHACIAALSTNVPNIPLAYSKKFIGIWEDFGLEKSVADLRFNSINKVLEVVDINYKNRYKLKEKIKSEMIDVTNKIKEVFEIIDNN